jgi:hypothetical protein
MAIVYLTGNRTFYISDAKGQHLMEQKATRPKDSLVDMGNEGFIEIGQIKGIKLEATDPENLQREERNAQIQELIKEYNDYIERLRHTSPDEKAHWMNRTFCQLNYNSRLNKGRLNKDSDIYMKLYESTYPYFESNPKEYHAPRDVYQNLIPTGNIELPKEVSGFKTLGSLIAQ